jgi:N-formylmaleamate deformylase
VLIELGGRSLFVSANGLRHHVLVYGPDTGLPLVIVNGITSPAAAADFLAVQLAERGFRVYVPDVRGRGLTPPVGPGGYRIDDYADDLAGLVEQLGLDRPVVIGHSMGARIAVRWSARRPGQHRLLIAVEPPTSGPGRGPYPTSKQQFLARLREAKQGITVEDVTLAYPNWPLRERQVRADILHTCDETAVAETHDGFESEDFFPDFARLSPPAVLVRGGESLMVPAQAGDELKRTNPAIPTEVVPGAGHMVMWDNPSGFWCAVSPHLDAALSS